MKAPALEHQQITFIETPTRSLRVVGSVADDGEAIATVYFTPRSGKEMFYVCSVSDANALVRGFQRWLQYLRNRDQSA